MKSLFIGNIGGCIGETSAILLLLGALLLLWKKIITWHIPLSYIATVAAFMGIYYYVKGVPNLPYAILFHILSGGLILGAFFMATDMVTSPVTKTGMIIFGIGCGVLASIIRLWGGYPEGVSYSILVMNGITPLIDKLTRPKVFGT
ncbi:MAG: Na(+)-translocating NADH-quinone reductase subunit B [Bacteroidetes bacterium ADurb.BinA245]|nr:MAG: Na(+)-translocating NADH-quinone reductase subunit B [Bacteroidetes bacterium ADurb.BinA245]